MAISRYYVIIRLEGLEKNHEEPQSGQPVPRPEIRTEYISNTSPGALQLHKAVRFIIHDT
jgi:hypothetical protein